MGSGDPRKSYTRSRSRCGHGYGRGASQPGGGGERTAATQGAQTPGDSASAGGTSAVIQCAASDTDRARDYCTGAIERFAIRREAGKLTRKKRYRMVGSKSLSPPGDSITLNAVTRTAGSV